MRVGKTPQAILAADKIGARRVLTVCPAIACEHWRREWERWSPERGPTLILSYDMARRKMADLVAGPQWDLVIADECHYAKNPEAARAKLIYGKKGLASHAVHLWALSGTPAPKHAGELWTMLRSFGATRMTYSEFTDHFCYANKYTGVVLGTRTDRIPELRALLAPIMLRRTLKDVAPEVPAIDVHVLPVAPRVPAGLKADWEGAPDDPRELAKWIEDNAAHLAEWRIAVATMKVEPLALEILGALDASLYAQTVVFGHHTEPLEMLAARLRAAGVRAELLTGRTTQGDRTRLRDAFHLGLVDVIVANITAAGTAIDLSAASHGYFLEASWVPGDNAQAVHRLVSVDKHEPVAYDLVSWSGSFDDRIQSVLARRVRELSQLM